MGVDCQILYLDNYFQNSILSLNIYEKKFDLSLISEWTNEGQLRETIFTRKYFLCSELYSYYFTSSQCLKF